MSHPRMMDPDQLAGMHVVDDSGAKVGKVSTVFLDVENGKPEWAAVKTGMFGGHETLVPLVNASATGSELTVPYAKDMIKSAPHHDPANELSNQDEADLFRHYGVPYSGETVTADTSAGTAPPSRGQSVGRDTSGPRTDDAMTRSEERLSVGTQQVEAGRARLRKHIVTETVTQTVPVSREEPVIQREPITDANRAQAMAGEPIRENEYEVTLHAEQPVVHKETVPVERVRLATETVTEQQQLSEQVRKEQIEQVVEEVPEGRTRL